LKESQIKQPLLLEKFRSEFQFNGIFFSIKVAIDACLMILGACVNSHKRA
jgi:hypothetical protein